MKNDFSYLPVELTSPTLIWLPEHGVGYFPCDDFTTDGVYNQEYFNKYTLYETQHYGRLINQGRVEFVEKCFGPNVIGVDVGIGCGSFVKTAIGTWYGYDVNPAGIEWLREMGIFLDIYHDDVPEVMTFFDSLEHIKDLKHLSKKLSKKVVVSIPIFKGDVDILGSKHFRKDEHFHYFTRKGLLSVFSSWGYALVAESNFETLLGRDSISTFAFEKP